MDTRYLRFKKGQDGLEVDKNKRPARPQAVAVGYDPYKDNAPRVVAAGKGLLAEQIINLARENNIPIREDPVLAAALSQVEIDEEIPPALYAVVAEVLAYVYRVQQRKLDV